MKVLFIHQNFPGQFRHVAPALAAAGHEVHALAITPRDSLPGVNLHRYRPERGNAKGVHPFALEFETKVIRGEACARAMQSLKAGGFEPDLIVAHPGWGESLFAKDVFPGAKMLAYLEYHYGGLDSDVGFDPEFPSDPFETGARQRMKNANSLLAYDAMDWGLSPTQWQRSRVPPQWRGRVSALFDGISTDRVVPDANAVLKLTLADGQTRLVKAGEEVLTFVNRNLEPYRGYHVFMRALPQILAARPNAIALIVGGDEVSYGAKAPAGTTWKQRFLDEVRDRLDMSRVFFLGKLPYPEFVTLLQVSACHVYLTYPFVLSWSCIEAMSAGALVVGSDTAPVREVITHGENGLLVNFFDIDGLARTSAQVLADPARFAPLRAAARRTAVERYDLTRICLPRQLALIAAVARDRASPSANDAEPRVKAEAAEPEAGAAQKRGAAA